MINQEPTTEERLEQAYDRMMERIHAVIERAEKESMPILHEVIENAREKAVELGELTREESVRIGDYLRRDLEDLGKLIADTSKELSDWFQFDLEQVETHLIEKFITVADKTRVELTMLTQQALSITEYRAGEVCGPGTLICSECNHLLHFKTTVHIAACPKCDGVIFVRETPPDIEEPLENED